MTAASILIVEDDANIHRFLRVVLEDEGFAVHEADIVRRGLVEAATRQPQLLIVDLGLPDQDGKTLIREFRTLVGRTRVGFVGTRSRRRKSRGLGC